MTDKITKIHAQLDQLLPELEAEKQKVLESLASEYAEREQLLAKIQPLEARLRELGAAIREKEKPLRAIGNSIAEIHRVKGAKSLRNG